MIINYYFHIQHVIIKVLYPKSYMLFSPLFCGPVSNATVILVHCGTFSKYLKRPDVEFFRHQNMFTLFFLSHVGETKECLGAAVFGRVPAGSPASEREDECGGAAGENEEAPESFSA